MWSYARDTFKLNASLSFLRRKTWRLYFFLEANENTLGGTGISNKSEKGEVIILQIIPHRSEWIMNLT